jgi:alanine racemase
VTPPSGPVARIDLDSLAHNFREVQRLVGGAVKILAMVKADAYGHGAVEVARALGAAGCTTFGVATLEEAGALRAHHALPAGARLLLFGGIGPAHAETAVDTDVEVVTHDLDVVRALGATARRRGSAAPLHLKVDTGMHRLGVEPEAVEGLVRAIANIDAVRAVGLCSHFAMAESVTTDVTAGQLERLLWAARAAGSMGQTLERHLANSAAIMTRPDTHLDMVRPGLMLYGLYPDSSLRGKADLKAVMSVWAPVVRVAEVGAGQGIGYGHSYHTKARARIATLRCGYADGYPRALSNRGKIIVGDGVAPVVGRVCMDHLMVDVSQVGTVRSGDMALVWGGPSLPAEDVAEAAGTISYELVARVGSRVVRTYADRAADREDAGSRT